MQILVLVLTLSGRDGSMPHDDMTLDEVFDSADRYMGENPISPETQAHLDAYKKPHSTDSERCILSYQRLNNGSKVFLGIV